MKTLLWSVVVLLLGAPSLSAQDQPADNMEIFAQKVKADKKLIIAANMGLTEKEAAGFWPLYENFQSDLDDLNRRSGELITRYADVYGKVTDEDAMALMDEYVVIQEEMLKLKKSYIPKLMEVLPGVKVARFLQIENKIKAVIDYELAALIPLVQ